MSSSRIRSHAEQLIHRTQAGRRAVAARVGKWLSSRSQRSRAFLEPFEPRVLMSADLMPGTGVGITTSSDPLVVVNSAFVSNGETYSEAQRFVLLGFNNGLDSTKPGWDPGRIRLDYLAEGEPPAEVPRTSYGVGGNLPAGELFLVYLDDGTDLAQGQYRLTLPENSVFDFSGDGNDEWNITFNLFAERPRVASVSLTDWNGEPLAGGTVTQDRPVFTLSNASGDEVSATIRFDRLLDSFAADVEDVILTNVDTGRRISLAPTSNDSAQRFFLDQVDDGSGNTVSSLTLLLPALREGNYSLTLVSGNDAFSDAFSGLALNGSPTFPLPSGANTVSGDDFVWHFSLDAPDRVVSLGPLKPFPGQMSVATLTGSVYAENPDTGAPADIDAFGTFVVEPGRRVSLALRPTGVAASGGAAELRLTVLRVDGGNAFELASFNAAAPGQGLLVTADQLPELADGGEFLVEVSSVQGGSAYSLNVVVDAVVDPVLRGEANVDAFANAVDLMPSSTSLGTNTNGVDRVRVGALGEFLRTTGVPSDGAPIFDSATGRFYQIVSAPGITWTNAEAEARSRFFAGMQGRLVSIASAEQGLWLQQTFSLQALERLWLGIRQLDGSNEPGDGWVDANTSTPLGFTNWGPGEPNNNGNPANTPDTENYVILTGAANASGPLWNDADDGSFGVPAGYLVEYGAEGFQGAMSKMFRIDLVEGQPATLLAQWAPERGVPAPAIPLTLELFDANGTVLATGEWGLADGGVTIRNFRPDATGTYFVRVVAYNEGRFGLTATLGMALDTEAPEDNNYATGGRVQDISATRAVLASLRPSIFRHFGGPFGFFDNTDLDTTDRFAFYSAGGETIGLELGVFGTDPGDPPGELTVDIQLLSPDGAVLYDSNPDNPTGVTGIGIGTTLPTQSGLYQVLVRPRSNIDFNVDAFGTYSLSISGTPVQAPNQALVPEPGSPFRTNQANGAFVSFTFDRAVRADSFDPAEDLVLPPGVTALSFSGSSGGRTVYAFVDLPAVDGAYTFTLKEGAVVDFEGNTNAAHTAQVVLDRVPPQFVSVAPQAGPAPLSQIVVTFDEPLDPSSVSPSMIEIDRPNGSPLDLSGMTATLTNGTDIVFTFASPLIDLGTYTYRLRPAARDVAGNGTDTDGDGTPGEFFDDAVTGTFIVGGADLVVSSITQTDIVLNGDVFRLSWTIRNDGVLPTTAPFWFDGVYLSSDATYDAGDLLVANATAIGVVLGAGESMEQGVNLQISAFQSSVYPRGEHYLIVRTDVDGRQIETDNANNTGVSAQTIRVVYPQDLAPGAITLPPTAAPGDGVRIQYTVTNTGDLPTSGSLREDFYLSSTPDRNGTIANLGNYQVPAGSLPVASGGSYAVDQTVTLPRVTSLVPGTYYIVVESDTFFTQDDVNRNNNVRAQAITLVAPSVPDLLVTDIAAPTLAEAGQTIDVSWTVTNHGNAALPNSTWTDVVTVVDANGATVLTSQNFPVTAALAVGGSLTRTQSITLPITLSGDYRVIVRTDTGGTTGAVYEHNPGEFDNTTQDADVMRVIQPRVPNLVVTQITPASVAFSGQNVTVSWTVQNTGNEATPSLWYDHVVLSADPIYNREDFQTLQSDNRIANPRFLAPGESYTNSATFRIPDGLQGDLYWIVFTDWQGQVYEGLPAAQNADNISAGVLQHVDLTPPPDLRVSTVTVPPVAFSGQPVTISYQVRNQGLGPTGVSEWHDFVYLSRRAEFDNTATRVTTVTRTGGLDAGGLEAGPADSYTRQATFSLPIGESGGFYVHVVTDAINQVYEHTITAEGNNAGSSAAIDVALTPPPDLVVSSVTAPAVVRAGEQLAFQYTLRNDGATITPNGSWADGVFLSTDAVLDESDLRLGGVIAQSIAAGAAQQLSGRFIVPVTFATGDYYLIVKGDADNGVFEGLPGPGGDPEANNTRSVIVRIEQKPADLVVETLQVAPAVDSGTAVAVSYTVRNAGTGSTLDTGWLERVVLSASGVYGAEDNILLATYVRDGLAAGESEAHDESVVLPTALASGNYTLFVVADTNNFLFEGAAGETNNLRAASIVVTRRAPDLAISAVTGPATATIGQTAGFGWHVDNVGVAATDSLYWSDLVYLSTDTVLSDDDLTLTSVLRGNPLASGAGYNAGVSITVPLSAARKDGSSLVSLTAGSYHLIFVADGAGQVGDPERSNNRATRAITLLPDSPPDLIVEGLTVPEQVYSGTLASLSWTLRNAGTSATTVTTYTSFYASRDAILDNADIYIGQTSEPAGMAVGAVRNVTQAVTIPGALNGPYFVFAVADGYGAVRESNEGNNVAMASGLMQVLARPPADIVVGTITIPADATAGRTATLQYTVTNLGTPILDGSRWQDAVYLSADAVFDANDALFSTHLRGGPIATGGSYTQVATAQVPAVSPGTYNVIVRSDIFNTLPETNDVNVGASLDRFEIVVPALVLDAPAIAETIAAGQSRVYRIDNVPAGEVLKITLDAVSTTSANVLYVSRGEVPSQTDFDFVSSFGFEPDAEIVIPATEAGTYYVLIRGEVNSGSQSVSLRADRVPFSIADVNAKIIDTSGDATLRIDGARFENGMVFELVAGNGTVISASRVVVDSPTEAYATFNTFTASTGTYSVRGRLASGTEVVVADAVILEEGEGGDTWVQVTGPAAIYKGQPNAFTVSYFNEGTGDAFAPLVIVESVANVPMGLTPATSNGLVPIFFMGASLDGAAEILRPGATYAQRVHFRTPDAIGAEIDFEVSRVDVGDSRTISDWSAIEQSVRPTDISDAQWQAWWGRVQPRIGTTWGELAQLLNRMMLMVSDTGEPPVRDVRAIFSAMVTEFPTFVPFVSLSGTAVDSASGTPQGGVEIAAYRETGQGYLLEGRAVTAADGSFVFAALRPGHYAFVLPERSFDMNADGTADSAMPGLQVTEADGQTVALRILPVETAAAIAEEDRNAQLVTDAAGTAHMVWQRNGEIWHATLVNGVWSGATRLQFGEAYDVTVHAMSNPGAGEPVLVAAWSEGNGNESEIWYAVGRRTVAGTIAWTAPIRLTDDAVADGVPTILEGDGGEVVIAHLKRNADIDDDSDFYVTPIDMTVPAVPAPAMAAAAATVTDGAAEGPIAEPSAVSQIQYAYSTGVDVGKRFGFASAKGKFSLAGAFAIDDEACKATVTATAAAELEFSGDTEGFKVGGGIAAKGEWKVDKAAKDWKLSKAQVDVLASFAWYRKYVVLRTLSLFPALTAPATALANVLQELNRIGLRVEDRMGFQIALKGSLIWNNDAKFPDILIPDDGKVRLAANLTPQFLMALGSDLPGSPVFVGSGKDAIKTPKAQITVKAGVEFEVSPVPGKDFTVNLTGEAKFEYLDHEITWAFTPIFQTFDATESSALDSAALAASSTPVWVYNPDAGVGTAARYGSNSLLPAVELDLLEDGGMVFARRNDDAYGVWSHATHGTTPGSVIRVADFDGAFGVPSDIPGTEGLNDSITAGHDAGGRRIVVWSRGKNAGIANGAGGIDAAIAAAKDVDLVYSVFENGQWSTPATVAQTQGRDTGTRLVTLADGTLNVVWVEESDSGAEVVRQSAWTGTGWTAASVVANAESITGLAVTASGAGLVAVWNQNTAGEGEEPVFRLFQSQYNGTTWSAATLLVVPGVSTAGTTAQVAAASGSPLEVQSIVPVPIPEKCLECDDIEYQIQRSKVCRDDVREVSERLKQGDKCIVRTVVYNPCSVRPRDPNDIVGPEGFGDEAWVTGSETLDYMIRFENAADATAPAQEIVVTQQLDADLDWRSFRLTGYGFGDARVDLDNPEAFHLKRLDMRATLGVFVDAFVNVDVASGLITMRLRAIDPATGSKPLDASVGLLPPNDSSGRGQGFFTYTVRPRADTESGARIDAEATIVFDAEEPIITPSIFNTIDAGVPTSAVTAFATATTENPTFLVKWSGADDGTTSGLSAFNVYVKEGEEGHWDEWQVLTTDTQAWFTGEAGKTYAFFSVAIDNAGNREADPPSDAHGHAIADADITIQGALPSAEGVVFEDTDGDGQQDAGESGVGGRMVFVDADLDGVFDAGEASVLTGADGAFRFDALAEGSYRFAQVIPSGWLPGSATPAYYSFNLVRGDVVTDIDFGDYRAAEIAGAVFADNDGDGVRDAGENGIAGATVRLDRDANGSVDLTVLSDADGNYRFTGLTLGTYRVTQVLPAGAFDTTPGGARTVVLDASGEAAEGTLLGRVIGAEIRGAKFEDVNGNSVRDAGENGLSGWTIFLDANGNGLLDTGERRTVTGADGTYVFSGLLPGTYTVAEVMQSGWMQTSPATSTGSATLTRLELTGSGATLELPDSAVEASAVASSAIAGNGWASTLTGLDAFRADSRFDGIDGDGMAVVVIDTGIDLDHPFFGTDADGDGQADRIVFDYDFADGDDDASDRNNHGSHVASLIGSSDDQYGGVAPEVDLISLKVFGDDGQGYFSYLEAALQWVVTNADRFNVGVVNLSLGDSGNWTDAIGRYGLGDEFAALAAKNIIVTAAAGNHYARFQGAMGVAYPAADPAVLAVGATWAADLGGPWTFSGGATDNSTGADRIASFSQRDAAQLDVFAPGARLVGANASGGTATMQGTSQASAYMAGVAALAQDLALEVHGRRLSTGEFERLVAASAVHIVDGDDEDVNVRRTGLTFDRIDVAALAEAILAFDPSSGDGGTGSGSGDGDGGSPGVSPSAGPAVRTIGVTAAEVVLGADFGNFRLGSVSGAVVHDLDADGVVDAGESGAGLSGFTVFLDGNSNGTLDTGESFTLTDGSGQFGFTDLGPGARQVRVVEQAGWKNVTTSVPVVMTSGATLEATLGVNAKPELAAIGDQTVLEGDTVSVVLQGADTTGDSLTYSVVYGPAGVDVDPDTGALTWLAADGDAEEIVLVRATDRAGSVAERSFRVTVSNVAPTLSATGATSVVQGQPYVLTLASSDVGDDTVSAWQIAWGDGTQQTFTAASGAPTHVYATPGSFAVTVSATDEDGTYVVPAPTVQVLAAGLQVTSFDQTDSGFRVRLSQALDASKLNLYDAAAFALGAADMTVTNSAGRNVGGSLVLDADNRGFAFVRTGGPLAAGSYTVTMRSAANAFVTSSGLLLDGNSDGTAGDAYVRNLVVSGTGAVLSIGEIARGPGQGLDAPATSAGLPVTLSNAAGATAVRFTLRYDAALISLSQVVAGAGLPAGSGVVFNIVSPGVVEVQVNAASALGAGALELVRVRATVSTTAPYGAKQVLDLTDVSINGGAIAVRADDGVHVVGFIGDTSGNARYSTLDVQRIQRVSALADTGFGAWPLVDPVIIGDVNTSGTLTTLDATRLQQFLVGVPRPEIPAIPSGIGPITFAGADPLIRLGTAIGANGATVAVPVTIDTTADLESIELIATYPAGSLELLEIRLAGVAIDFQFVVKSSSTPGRLALDASRFAQLAGGGGRVADLVFRITNGAKGVVPIDLQWAALNETRLTLNPEPKVGPDMTDGKVYVVPPRVSTIRVPAPITVQPTAAAVPPAPESAMAVTTAAGASPWMEGWWPAAEPAGSDKRQTATAKAPAKAAPAKVSPKVVLDADYWQLRDAALKK